MDSEAKRRMEALSKAKGIVTKRYRNPSMQNKSLAQNVESEIGAPSPPTAGDRERAKESLKLFLNRKGLDGLPRLSEKGRPGVKYGETGNPKKDLKEISGQLTKASNMHARQSDRVGKIAKKLK